MHRAQLILAFLAFLVGLSWGQLPTLPEYYSTRIQANIVDKARRSAEKGLGEGAGLSVSFFEAVEGDKAYLKYESEIVLPSKQNAFVFAESIIYNPEISGVKEFLSVATFGNPVEATFCNADNLHENSLLAAVMGIGGNTFPSVAHMLHMDGSYTEGDPAQVNGIPCKTFKGEVKVDEPDLKGTFSIIYYWSDQYNWLSTGGTNVSVPVQAIMTGEEVFHNEAPKFIEVYFEFSNFLVARPYGYFDPPSDLWCAGRQMTESVPQVPEYYSYLSEAIFHYKPQAEDHKPFWVVSPRQEYYDFPMKVSRTDYKPIDFGNPDDPYAGDGQGFVNEVKDFMSGLKYRTYQSFGNCTISYIGIDTSGDIHINPDGTIDMESPNQMWGFDKKFAYNGIFAERGIEMKSYLTMEAKKGSDAEPYVNFTTAIWYSQGRFAIVGNEDPQYHVPVKIETYDANRYNDLSARVMYNIVGFKQGEPDFNLFDVTACFAKEMVSHKMLKLGYDSNFDIYQGLKLARDQVRAAVAASAGVTPIRVQNIELFQEPDQNALYVLFTLLDYPQGIVPDEGKIPEEAKRPLKEALDNLYAVVSKGTFKVELPTTSGAFGALYADKSYFETVDRTQPSNPKANPNEIYTPGNMALLAFFMIVLGCGLSGAVYFFFLRPRVRSQLPTVRGFDNPLHGSANLAATT